MVNKVFLIGRLGKDPQIKTFSNENAIAEFTLATNESYKDREGKWVEVTDWHNIKLPTKGMAERAEKMLRKGSSVFIEGKIKTRSYDDKDGNKRYITEIVVDNFRLLDKREGGTTDSGSQQSVSHESTGSSSNQVENSGGFDDDLPF
jgi:single-strand DNA-binding protein